MKSKTLWILLWISIITGGALLRVIGLNARPMHTDESVHADKFGTLLEKGLYTYDPHEFHGPTLNFCTLFSAMVRGEQTYAQIEEVTLRLVPAVFGTLLILTPLFFTRGLGKTAVFVAAVLLAFSPAFVYYSRYYIQEMLLVFFTACFLGCLWQYSFRRTLPWIIFAGCFLGLMHASKETFVFSLAAAALAGILAVWRHNRRWTITFFHAAAGLISFASVSAAFFSTFGLNPEGIVDSWTTYGIWIKRAAGQSVHIHPWYFYLDLLTWLEFFEPLTWNEDGIVALALLGTVWAFLKRAKRSEAGIFFLAAYALVLTVIYCVLPYKTPWSMLSFLFGMAMVAGWMANRLLETARYNAVKVILAAVLCVYALVSPLVQSKMLAFDFAADPQNPYVYAHTSEDIFRMVDQVKAAAYASGQGRDVPIQIVAEGNDYWPWPWYLRDFSKVGYWTHADPALAAAPIILAQSRLEPPVLKILYSAPPPGQRHLYFPLLDPACSLRPGVYWQGYIRKDLWDRMHEQSTPNEEIPSRMGNLMDVQSGKDEIQNLLKFSHKAMNTTFEIFLQHEDPAYAAAAAKASFDMVDRLESRLSRFIENSDISRINAAPAGEPVVVDPDTMQCLLTARQAYELTSGAFDISIGTLTPADAQHAQTPPQPKAEQLPIELHSDYLEASRLNPSIQLDLGGIGKGFAVDKIAEVLAEWSISRALIHGGASSVKALQPPDGKAGWPVKLSDPRSAKRVLRLEVANEVLGCSGISKGLHIIDPATGKPVEGRLAAWVRLPEDAALADAFSTAAMIMPLDKLAWLQENTQDCSIKILSVENGPSNWITFGDRFQN